MVVTLNPEDEPYLLTNSEYRSIMANPLKQEPATKCISPVKVDDGQPLSSVKKLVDHLLSTLLPDTVKRRNLVINDISPELTLDGSDEKIIRLVLGNLLSEVLRFTSNDCIRIQFGEQQTAIITLTNRKLGTDNGFHIFTDTLQLISQRMGGPVSIFQKSGKRTTLSVNFNIRNKAA